MRLANDPSTEYICLDVRRQLHVSATKGSHYKAIQKKKSKKLVCLYARPDVLVLL
jgi:hypothetical protein